MQTWPVDPDPLLSETPTSVAEMADALGLKEHTFRAWVTSGRVPALKVGSHWLCIPAKVVYDIARSGGIWETTSTSNVYDSLQRRLRAEGYGQKPPASGATPAPMPRGRQRTSHAYDLPPHSEPPTINVVTRELRPRPAEPRIVTVAELAKILKVSPAAIYDLATGGKIPAMKVGGRWRFDMDDVLDRLQEPIDMWAQPARSHRRKRAT